MAPEQDWCLECGAAVTTRVVPPPGWRLPLVAGLAVLALLGIGVASAVSAIADDADRAAGPRGAQRGTATTRARTPTAGRTTTVAVGAEAAAGRAVPRWPARQRAYTVVAPSGRGRPGAERQARRLIAGGARAGILQTDGYDFFRPGGWIVWVGRFPDRAAAEAGLAKVRRSASGAYVTLIRPRGGG